MKNKSLYILCLFTLSISLGCKKQLDITNVNQPTPASAVNESGLISLAQGSIYRNGFFDLKYSDGVYGRFWAGTMGFQELMGDVIGAEAANAFMNQIGCPNKVILDNGSEVINPNQPRTQYELVRYANQNAQGGSNTTFYEWAYMYNMITAANGVLQLLEKVTFTGPAASIATKRATIQAWAYWWKGFAYGHIGSIYYAGLIQNASTADASTNGNYVTKEAIIAESNSNYDKAITALGLATSTADYTSVLSRLIPTHVQLGRGGVLTPVMWTRTINTMKARNILVNTTLASMTAAQWNNILTLTANGVTNSDMIFTGRTNATGSFLENTVADKTSQNATTGSTNTYKLSERWVQEFLPGDKRRDNNVLTLASVGLFNSDRGNAFNTRYTLKNQGNGMAGVIVYSNQTAGLNEINLAATFEENNLMRAEALIQTGQVAAAAPLIDAVRTYQGAGLAPMSTSLSQADAYEQLRRERRIALAFQGLSFYDARRWGIIEPNTGRTGCTVVTFAAAVNTNAKIIYGYLDYWDVPDNELAYNPAASGSAPTANPKK